MYRGFNVDLVKGAFEDTYVAAGESLFAGRQATLKPALDACVRADGSLDGGKISSGWFPQVACDVFLSHSHGDRELAIGLSGWLHDQLGLTSFVDSCLWGYADDLLATVDKAQSWNKETGHYSYELRNITTAHVHAMLATSLAAMMDATECLMFINTPLSTKGTGKIRETESPWIFSEIEASRMMRRVPKRGVIVNESVEGVRKTAGAKLAAKFRHRLDLAHLAPIGADELIAWNKAVGRGPETLDVLYGMIEDPQV